MANSARRSQEPSVAVQSSEAIFFSLPEGALIGAALLPVIRAGSKPGSNSSNTVASSNASKPRTLQAAEQSLEQRHSSESNSIAAPTGTSLKRKVGCAALEPSWLSLDPSGVPPDPNGQPLKPNGQPLDPNAQPLDPNAQPLEPNVLPSSLPQTMRGSSSASDLVGHHTRSMHSNSRRGNEALAQLGGSPKAGHAVHTMLPMDHQEQVPSRQHALLSASPFTQLLAPEN